MDAIIEFAEDYEPSHVEVLRQANRRLHFHDRSSPNSLLGLTRLPFDDGTGMDLEFYKPAVYEYDGVNYEVVLSTVICEGQDEISDRVVYLNLKNPNEEEILYASFTITNYAHQNEVVGELSFYSLDDMVANHEDVYDLYNFLYDYGMDGVAIKEDGGVILNAFPQNGVNLDNLFNMIPRPFNINDLE